MSMGLFVLGRVTETPEIRGEGEKRVAIFSVACDNFTGGKEKTEFFQIKVFSPRLVTFTESNVKKGKRYLISSSNFGTEEFVDASNNKRSKFVIRANDISFADGK